MRAALLIMDYQVGIVQHTPGADQSAQHAAAARANANKRQTPVIFVHLGFRAGHPEVAPHDKIFSGLRAGSVFVMGNPEAQSVPALTPGVDDIVVNKRRVSGFTGTDLDVVLRAQGIGRVVLAGVATSGVVLSTAVNPAEHGYDVVVLSDACADSDPELHETLVTKVFGNYMSVSSVDEWSQQDG
jgi:nicotinamidase-related amidase